MNGLVNLGRRHWLGLRNSLWFLPSLVVAASAALAVALIEIDETASLGDTRWAFGGTASAARSVLSTVAASLITVTGLTLSITIVVLQLASSQFSPRVLRNFLADRMTQLTVGASLGVFVYSLMVLRSVRSEQESVVEFVPSLSVTVAIVLAVVALIVLIAFIHHISKLIQVSSVAARIADETFRRIDDLYPEPYGAELGEDAAQVLADWDARGEPVRIGTKRAGFVQAVHVDQVEHALDGETARVAVDVAPGDFVGVDDVLLRIWDAELDDGTKEAVQDAITVGDERDTNQDVGFGLRQLTDVALRALSPSMNDPTTAITCVGYIGSITGRLACRSFPSQARELDDGRLTVVARRPSFGEYLDSVAEIAAHANGDVRVVQALLRALAGIAAAADRAEAGDRAREARELAREIADGTDEEADALLERVPEPLGKAPRDTFT